MKYAGQMVALGFLVFCSLIFVGYYQNNYAKVSVAQAIVNSADAQHNDIQLLGNVSNPNGTSYVKGAFARNVWTMQEFDGKIYVGHGNASNNVSPANAGPIAVIAIDPFTNRLKTEYTINGEEIWRYCVVGDKLYLPDIDPKESWSMGNLYIKESTSDWVKKRTITGSIHAYDVVDYHNRLWIGMSSEASGNLRYSEDGGDTWQLGTTTTQSSGTRIRALIASGGSLYPITQAIYSAGRLSIYGGKITSEGQNLNLPTSVTNTTLSSNSMTGRELINGTGYNIRDRFDFKGSIVFSMQSRTDTTTSAIGPGGVYYTASFPNNIAKLNLPDSNANAISAFTKDGAVYVLAYIENSATSFTNIVYKTTDFSTVTEVLRFDYGSFALSFEKLTGQDEFFFGIGTKAVSPSVLAGNILRISLSGQTILPPNNNADLAFLHRSASHANPLTGVSESLSSETNQFVPAFRSDITEYSLTVPYRFNRISLTRSVAAVGATATAATNVNLNVGVTPVFVTVTAPDGVTKKTYTVNVTRNNPGTTTTLSTLSVTNTSGNTTYALSPGYTSGTTLYNVTVPSNISTVNVNARSSSSTITPVSSPDITMTSAYDSATGYVNATGQVTSLVEGVPKPIRVVVTAESGAARSYTVILTRQGTTPSTALSVAINSLPSVKRGNSYSTRLTAIGGTEPYTWTATGLPAGLSIAKATGVISGTPTAATGIYDVVATVTDNTKATSSKTLTLSIDDSINTLFISTESLPTGATEIGYNTTVTSNGGTSPYIWSATGLPSGLTIGTGTGIISGVPAVAGVFNIELSVQDGIAAAANRTLSLTIADSTIIDAQMPNITTQPLEANVTLGDTVMLSVVASVTDGGLLTYQWYRNTTSSTSGATLISGATNVEFSASTGTAGTHYYFVVITNTNNGVNGQKVMTITSSIVAITISAGIVETIDIPVIISKTHNRITVAAAAALANGQVIEYAISKNKIVPTTGWQTNLTFSGLDSDTEYYIFARAKANDQFNAGEPVITEAVKTMPVVNGPPFWVVLVVTCCAAALLLFVILWFSFHKKKTNKL